MFGRHLGAIGTDDMIDCTERDRNRIFNLGYYTWVEQQGTPIDVFEARRAAAFWQGLRRYLGVWDELIDDFNARVARAVVIPATAARSAPPSVPIATAGPWRCPNATAGRPGPRPAHRDRRRSASPASPPDDDPNPFVAYRARMAWYAFAAANGMADGDAVALVRELDAAVAAVDGTGFRDDAVRAATDGLSDALGFTARGGVWVKDETGNVAGSHKARHLMGVLLHLEAAERLGLLPRAPGRLAIASCGNAALAAATLAAAVGRPLDVFVPPAADHGVVERLGAARRRRRGVPPAGRRSRRATRASTRFRAAVDAGAVPFSVQGPDDALCLDGGRTIGWELAAQCRDVGVDRVFVQVGGGALATAVGDALRDEGSPARIHAVQVAGCAPFARAWACVQERRCGPGGTPLGRRACGRGRTSRRRRRRASSTTRPTTGWASSTPSRSRVVRRSSPVRRTCWRRTTSQRA